jgi:Tripartite tricarboxylate transporter TctB family
MFRSQQDAAAGVFLIFLGGLALLLSGNLPSGTLRSIGPGMLPKTFAWVLVGLGALLLIQALRIEGPRLERWNLRGILFVVGGICAFALAIRGFEIGPLKVPPLGLAVAGPLVVIIAGQADPDTRWKELLIFAAVMTTFCGLLFKYILGLPIPLAPWLLNV